MQRLLAGDGVAPSTLQPHDVAWLQSTVGNRGVQRLLLDPAPGQHEAQAEAMQRATGSDASGEPAAAGGIAVDKAMGKAGGVVAPPVEARIRRSQGGGAPLPAPVQNTLQTKLQADFKNVRTHTDDNAVQLARDLNAQAFTYKNHIFYGEGKTPHDLALTTHEAVHTMQQGAVTRQMQPGAVTRGFDSGLGEKDNGGSSRLAQPAVQRLPTAEQLEGTAGTAKSDWKIGKLTLRKMSTKYKAVLATLRNYDRVLAERVGGDLHGYSTGGAWDIRATLHLDDLEAAVDTYLAAHGDDDRAGQIRALKAEIPQERTLIQYIGAHPDRFANATGREALLGALKGIAGDKARSLAQAQHFGDGKSHGALVDVVSGQNEEANESMREELKDARTGWEYSEGKGLGQAFRGSDVLSKTSAEFAKGNFLSYYLTTVVPAFGEVVEALRGSGIGLLKDQNLETTLEERSTDPAVYSTISTAYLRFARTLMRALPIQLVNGAALVYARIRSQTKTDSEEFSKKLALGAASNMIYVRCFGPALNVMSGGMGEGDLTRAEKQALTAIVQLLAKQGPGVDLGMSPGSEYERLGMEEGVQAAGLEYQRILNEIQARGARLLQAMH